MHNIQPAKYARTRNFGNGAVTYLSPYISRGVISTLQVYNHIKQTGVAWQESEKLIQELAWRDYWQQVWLHKGDTIFSDLKHPQSEIDHDQIPSAVIHAKTGIIAVDKAIEDLYTTGYMHNHMRMYVAAICCNMAKSHWLAPAQWLYAHLLDGDLASNHLSWQWVAGSFSNKKYYANQDNINTYFDSNQKNTFLDVDYSHFNNFKIPSVLKETNRFHLDQKFPEMETPSLEQHRTTLIYNYYNLDPFWHKDEQLQRILLLEPSIFRKYPVKKRCIDFALELASNITDIKLYIGEFEELQQELQTNDLIFKEHPLNSDYKGQMEQREWMSSVTGYYPSFFSFWKKCKKELIW